MIKIASFLDDISISQNSYCMIREFNKLSSNNVSACCFYHNIAPVPINMNFALLNAYYLSHWNGSVFATTLQTANTLIKTPGPSRKFLYLLDLEWLRHENDFHENMKILRDPSLTLVARGLDHADAIENYCNIRPKYILQDWNAPKILEIING